MNVEEVEHDDFVVASVEMIGRTGARHIQIRYSDDEQPVIWLAVAAYTVPHRARSFGNGGQHLHYVVGADTEPRHAFLNLLDKLMDGGMCQHCHRPTGVTMEIMEMPLDGIVCWYQYDPELKLFRRGCE